MRFVILLALVGLTQAATAFTVDGAALVPLGATMGLGFILLTAWYFGTLFAQVGLPKLTGYIAAGIVVGPYVLGLVDAGVVGRLQIFNGVAIALIALTAGTEFSVREMKPLIRTIGWISLIAIGGTVVLLTLTVFLARALLPFMAGLDTGQAFAIAAVLGTVIVAQSPAVVVALRDETDASGPMVQTVLGVVVFADLIVIILFALVSSLGRAAMGGGADLGASLSTLAWEIFGSFAAGALIGGLLYLYLRFVRGSVELFVIAVVFMVAEVGQRLHLDPLIIALAAGIIIRNLTHQGEVLHHAIDKAAVPVYIVFFAVTGAGIHLDVMAVVGLPAVLLVAVRAFGLLAGARLATRVADAPPVIQRFAGFGLLPQAGLALALALIVARVFPELGDQAAALVLGIVAINEIVAPAIYRLAIMRSGEGAARHAAADAPEPAPTAAAADPLTSPDPALGEVP